jgi:hypothetical protein
VSEDERDQLREAVEEYDQLLTRLRDLLTGTANALKGDPGPLKLHDWSDLPAVAAAMVVERDRLRAEILRAGAERIDSMSVQYGCPDCGVHHACNEIVAERDQLRALVFLLYRSLSDEPIDGLMWLRPEHRDLLARVVDDLSPHLNPERTRTAMQMVTDDRDRLRAVVYQIWRAWNALSIKHDDETPLNLGPGEGAVLDEAIVWATDHGLREQINASADALDVSPNEVTHG